MRLKESQPRMVQRNVQRNTDAGQEQKRRYSYIPGSQYLKQP